MATAKVDQEGYQSNYAYRFVFQICETPNIILQNWIQKDHLRTSSYKTQRKSNLVDYPRAPTCSHELTVTNEIVFQNLSKSIHDFTKLNPQGSSRDFKLQDPKKSRPQ